MTIDPEFAIKKDIRNNPVVREIDRAQRRDFLRSLLTVGAIVGMLLFSAWQHFATDRRDYAVESKRARLAAARAEQRRWQLERERTLAPRVIDERARQELDMVDPDPAHTLILERATPASGKASTAVAEVR
ncbi:MAG: hypothetical protein R2752_18440 [Vicinamibacterales bacterium]